jgi:nucleoside-diphosphate-sugar epimerase
MKRVLITGKNSYVGTNVESWLMREPDKYTVERINMRDPKWREFDFSKFDVVFHVAGIVHMKETKKSKELFSLINQDMAIETAKKAKTSGVSQFIFMSTMNVYGLKKGSIGTKTRLKPTTEYGKSKRNAEVVIQSLESSVFKVVIVRPPMIYGPRAVGNYLHFSNFVKKYRIFPKIDNKKSFIFIDHFSEFIRIIIFKSLMGIFHPQNSFLVSATNIVEEIDKLYIKKIYISKIFNFIILFNFITKVSKVFNSLYYDKSLYSEQELQMINDSSIYDFKCTIKLTENYP